MSPFERVMINRLDNMASDQRNHYEFCVVRFQHLHDQIEVVHTKLLEFKYSKDELVFKVSIYVTFYDAELFIFILFLLLLFLFYVYVSIHSLSLFVKTTTGRN